MTHLEQLNKLPSPAREDAIKVITNHMGSDWLQKSTFTSLDSVLLYGLPRMAKKWIDVWYLASIGMYDKNNQK